MIIPICRESEWGLLFPIRDLPSMMCVFSVDYFVTFPSVVGTEGEADQRYAICDVIDMLIAVHDVGGELGETGIAHDGHDQKGGTAFRLVAQSLQCQGELCGVHNRHEEGDCEHGIESHHSAIGDNDDAQYDIDDGVSEQHVLRLEFDHQRRANPAPGKEGQHVKSEKCRRCLFGYSRVRTAVYQKEAVECCLSAIIEELGDDTPSEM